MNEGSIKTIIAQATALNGVYKPDITGDYPFAIVPDGYKLESLEKFQVAPYRKRGKVAFHQAASFGQYVVDHDQGSTALFCDRGTASFQAILDYHRYGTQAIPAPGWKQHVATFQMKPTVEWETWAKHDSKQFTQVQFGEFLEQHLPDISHPDGASLLEIALTLEEKRAVTFRSAIRLGDGMRQFKYEEEKVGAGELKVPEVFELSLEPYEGSGKQRVDARLRYRIQGGELSFYYQLIRPLDAQLKAVDEAQEVVEKVTGLTCYMGMAAISSFVNENIPR